MPFETTHGHDLCERERDVRVTGHDCGLHSWATAVATVNRHAGLRQTDTGHAQLEQFAVRNELVRQ